MNEYVVQFNNDQIMEDYNGIFSLNGKEYDISLPGSTSFFVIELPEHLVCLIKLGRYKKYIHKIAKPAIPEQLDVFR